MKKIVARTILLTMQSTSLNNYHFNISILRRVLQSALLMITVVTLLPGQWSTNPAVNNALCTATGNQLSPRIASDGLGGAVITWYDNRSGNYDIYAQRISATGTLRWSTDGAAICTATGIQQYPQIASDGSGGAIITWQDSRSGNYDIYAQHISLSGGFVWAVNGTFICAATGNQNYPAIVSDGTGGAIITWQDNRSGNYDIYAQRISATGILQWSTDGVVICTATGIQQYPQIASDHSGGAIITWQDNRSGNYDIYAQRINSSGVVQWNADGVAICSPSGDQLDPRIADDGGGGAVITWTDQRSGSDIYAQKVHPWGTLLWATDGVAICTATGNQVEPTIIGDGSAGAIITWCDYRNGTYDIFAQRVNSAGAVQWASNGAVITLTTGSQESPTLVSDGSGGAIITWCDSRNGSYDIYAQRVNSAGVVQWAANGAVVSLATGNQESPTLVSDGSGGATIAWTDFRNFSSYDIYSQRVDRYGYLGDASANVAAIRDVANDQGGKIRVMWDPSYVDSWPDTTVQSYTLWMGTKTTGIVGKTGSAAGMSGKVTALGTEAGGIYWQSAGSVAANWLPGYGLVVNTYADSGLQGIPMYYFQVTAQSKNPTMFWTSNVDSGFSIDNIPPVGISGAIISPSGDNRISLLWHKDRVDPDLMGYQIYRSTTTGFALDKSNILASSHDTSYIDESTTPGQMYYYRVAGVDIHGNLGTPCSELNQQALAVTLTSFTATPSHLCARLHWLTTTETNNYGFEIERRSVGEGRTSLSAWQKIGFVSGSGTTSSPKKYEYVDRSVTVGTFNYRIKLIQTGGSYAYSPTVEAVVGLAPKKFTLSQNYPNPFNPTTTIEFTLQDDGNVSLKLYDITGREVATLLDEERKAGYYQSVTLDASRLGSGMYVYRIEANGKAMSRKMLLVK